MKSSIDICICYSFCINIHQQSNIAFSFHSAIAHFLSSIKFSHSSSGLVENFRDCSYVTTPNLFSPTPYPSQSFFLVFIHFFFFYIFFGFKNILKMYVVSMCYLPLKKQAWVNTVAKGLNNCAIKPVFLF